jgi:hypothetical protein
MGGHDGVVKFFAGKLFRGRSVQRSQVKLLQSSIVSDGRGFCTARNVKRW